MPRDWPDPRFPHKPLTWLEVAFALVIGLLVLVGTISLVGHIVGMIRGALE